MTKWIIVFFTIIASSCMPMAVSAQDVSTEAAPVINQKYLEEIVIMNETGQISISYDDPWWFEIAEYSNALLKAMEIHLDEGREECAVMTQSLVNNDTYGLGPSSYKLLTSLQYNGRTDYSRLMTSLLRKYSHKNSVDKENASTFGHHRALRGEVCNRFSTEGGAGVIQRMVVLEVGRHEGVASWACAKITQTANCLDKLIYLSDLNQSRLKGRRPTRIALSKNTVFEPITPPGPDWHEKDD